MVFPRNNNRVGSCLAKRTNSKPVDAIVYITTQDFTESNAKKGRERERRERRYFLLRSYGVPLDLAERAAILLFSDCWLCKTYCKVCIDHNHHNGRFRGFLCSQCNTGIGLLETKHQVLSHYALEYVNADPQSALDRLHRTLESS